MPQQGAPHIWPGILLRLMLTRRIPASPVLHGLNAAKRACGPVQSQNHFEPKDLCGLR